MLAFLPVILLNTAMHDRPRSSISAFIVCHNEERQIRRCLESVKWCDEIIVVDSGSTDKTLDICREYTSKIYFHAWEGYVIQKRYALEQCSSDWVLNIDADEEVSESLHREMTGILEWDARENTKKLNGYYLNRVVFFLDRWWRKGGWYPEYRLRLCRRSETTWGGQDPHEKASVNGATARCLGELHHYSFTDLTDYVRRLNTLSSNAATTLAAKGRKASVLDLLARPVARFFKFYVSKQGFREGTAGLVIALIEANAAFLKYAKVWEITRKR